MIAHNHYSRRRCRRRLSGCPDSDYDNEMMTEPSYRSDNIIRHAHHNFHNISIFSILFRHSLKKRVQRMV